MNFGRFGIKQLENTMVDIDTLQMRRGYIIRNGEFLLTEISETYKRGPWLVGDFYIGKKYVQLSCKNWMLVMQSECKFMSMGSSSPTVFYKETHIYNWSGYQIFFLSFLQMPKTVQHTAFFRITTFMMAEWHKEVACGCIRLWPGNHITHTGMLISTMIKNWNTINR